MAETPLRMAVVGVGGRGAALASLFDSMPAGSVAVTALCDTAPSALEEGTARFDSARAFSSFEELLSTDDPADAVLISTPMPLHAPMSAAALRRGLHVLCEVPAAVSIAQSRTLVEAAAASPAVYAMAENYLFSTANRMVRAIAHAGLFGTLYYGRGAYIHELKALNERTPWRRHWQTGIRGITYPTHSLGPVLDWTGERVAHVFCADTGSHYTDATGSPYHQDSATLLGRLSGGGLVEVRLDMVSDRPHSMASYELQGTDGAYEAREDGERVWLRALDPKPRWRPLAEAYEELVRAGTLVPLEPSAPGGGHGGGDAFVLREFLRLVSGGHADIPDIHRALDMTLPGIVSQQVIGAGSWGPVPDSRLWTGAAAGSAQVMMTFPPQAPVPELRVPAGYRLEQLADADRPQYVALMQSAGFQDWSAERFAWVERAVLPEGHFVLRHEESGKLAATALAAHRPSEDFRFAGELGWVATLPEHTGRGLGRAVCTAVLRRFREAGYRNIYLFTETYRAPAIALYLRLGFVPFLREDGERRTWQAALARLGWTRPVPCAAREGVDSSALAARPAS